MGHALEACHFRWLSVLVMPIRHKVENLPARRYASFATNGGPDSAAEAHHPGQANNREMVLLECGQDRSGYVQHVSRGNKTSSACLGNLFREFGSPAGQIDYVQPGKFGSDNHRIVANVLPAVSQQDSDSVFDRRSLNLTKTGRKSETQVGATFRQDIQNL